MAGEAKSRLDRLIDSLADGAPVDWGDEQRRAEGEHEQALIRVVLVAVASIYLMMNGILAEPSYGWHLRKYP